VAAGALARTQKKAAEEGSTIVWGDESAFYLLPHAVRTWAPCGQTPCLRVKLSTEHLSAISGVTLDGRLFLQVREHSFDSYAVVGFLRVLLHKLRGKILLLWDGSIWDGSIWDGSPIHRGLPVKDFLRRGAAKRLHLEQLPGYAPDLNPAEGVWSYLKRASSWRTSAATICTSCKGRYSMPASACVIRTKFFERVRGPADTRCSPS
jgi:transposase